ncbi:hypothetical protein NMG60_11018127 [Bertholletia excelsa]
MGAKSQEKPKQKHKKGLWSPDEDQRLKNYILKHGHGCWSSVPINAGLQRNGKSCRLRWINYLRPGLKRGMFTASEEETILTLHGMLGNKWSQIAQHLPGRTDNEIKNYWHSYLKKKEGKQGKAEPNESTRPNAESTGRNPCSESTEHKERSSIDTNCSINDFPREAGQSSLLPKLLFAEWLSLDQFQGQDSRNYSISYPEAASKEEALDQNSSFYDPFINGLLMNEGLFGGDDIFHQQLSNGSADEIFHPEFKAEDLFSGNGIFSLVSDHEMYSQFNMHSDVMYM